jgi:hypothetical protein
MLKGFCEKPSRANCYKNTNSLRGFPQKNTSTLEINPLNAELNPICHLLALLGAHHILHVSRIRVKFHRQLGNFNSFLAQRSYK